MSLNYLTVVYPLVFAFGHFAEFDQRFGEWYELDLSDKGF